MTPSTSSYSRINTKQERIIELVLTNIVVSVYRMTTIDETYHSILTSSRIVRLLLTIRSIEFNEIFNLRDMAVISKCLASYRLAATSYILYN
jgi:hypothetical protein